MAVFLGIGECMVELSDAGEGLLRRGFAGDVLNTLWYARAALGEDWSVRFHTAVGRDPMSAAMLDFIAGAGIETDGIARIEGRRPGLYMIHLDGAERSFSYWREQSAARLLAADAEVLVREFECADLIYLSGITLAILSPDHAETLFAALEAATAKGVRVAFDPNIRPALWPDREEMATRIRRAASLSSLVLPSFDDERAAFGDASPEATIERYRDWGAGLVVLKDGERAVLCADKEGTVERFDTTPAADAVDTTGAGDSFNGAFLATWLETAALADAVRAGQDCAARVVCHRGALIPRE